MSECVAWRGGRSRSLASLGMRIEAGVNDWGRKWIAMKFGVKDSRVLSE
jgi:hypothetical protein